MGRKIKKCAETGMFNVFKKYFVSFKKKGDNKISLDISYPLFFVYTILETKK